MAFTQPVTPAGPNTDSLGPFNDPRWTLSPTRAEIDDGCPLFTPPSSPSLPRTPTVLDNGEIRCKRTSRNKKSAKRNGQGTQGGLSDHSVPGWTAGQRSCSLGNAVNIGHLSDTDSEDSDELLLTPHKSNAVGWRSVSLGSTKATHGVFSPIRSNPFYDQRWVDEPTGDELAQGRLLDMDELEMEMDEDEDEDGGEIQDRGRVGIQPRTPGSTVPWLLQGSSDLPRSMAMPGMNLAGSPVTNSGLQLGRPTRRSNRVLAKTLSGSGQGITVAHDTSLTTPTRISSSTIVAGSSHASSPHYLQPGKGSRYQIKRRRGMSDTESTVRSEQALPTRRVLWPEAVEQYRHERNNRYTAGRDASLTPFGSIGRSSRGNVSRGSTFTGSSTVVDRVIDDADDAGSSGTDIDWDAYLRPSPRKVQRGGGQGPADGQVPDDTVEHHDLADSGVLSMMEPSNPLNSLKRRHSSDPLQIRLPSPSDSDIRLSIGTHLSARRGLGEMFDVAARMMRGRRDGQGLQLGSDVEVGEEGERIEAGLRGLSFFVGCPKRHPCYTKNDLSGRRGDGAGDDDNHRHRAGRASRVMDSEDDMCGFASVSERIGSREEQKVDELKRGMRMLETLSEFTSTRYRHL